MGSALANLLSKAGCEVTQEYYVNDQGLQIETLGLSLLLNYLSLAEKELNYQRVLSRGLFENPASDLKKINKKIRIHSSKKTTNKF